MLQSTKIMKYYLSALLLPMIMMLAACNDEVAPGKQEKNNDRPVSELSTVSINQTVNQAESLSNSNSLSKKNSYSIEQYKHTDFKILDFSQRNYQGVSSLGLVLSIPLDSDSDFQKYFVLERKDGQRVDGAWILSDNGKELFFKNIESETSYLLTVYGNLKSFNQQVLGHRFRKTITTKPIESSISFAHDGGVLPLTHANGLPVYSINVEQVDIDFHRVKQDQILPFLKQWQGGKESYYRLKQYASKSDFVYSSRFELPVEKNKRERVILPIDSIEQLKPAGIYLAVMKQAGQYDYRQSVTYFIRSDIGVHVRRYPGALHAYLRSLVTAEPLTDLKVSLLDHQGIELVNGLSDSNGIVKFNDALNSAHLLLVQNQQQMSLVRLNSPALDLSEFNIGQQQQNQNEAFFYAPRDLYRPGEQVEISLLLRDFDGYSLPNIPLQAVLKRPDGQEMQRFTWHSETLGYYFHQFQLPDNARTGRWRIEVILPGENQRRNNTVRQWQFSVEDFLPERMKLTMGDSEQESVVSVNDTLIIPVEGRYLYGAAASGNRLETQIRSFIDQKAVPALPGYHFGLSEEEQARTDFNLEPVKLDDEGKVQLTISPRWKNIQSPARVQVIGSLFETGGRAVKRQKYYRLWPARTLIGIRPHWLKNTDDNEEIKEPPANTLLSFDVINADSSGILYDAQNLSVTLIKQRRDYYWRYNSSDEWEMDYSEKQYPVFEQTIDIENKSKMVVSVPVEWGHYRLEISNPATNLKSSIEFTAGGDWYYQRQQARISRPDKINLSLDKKAYRAEEQAELTIRSPFAGKGMLLVESNEGLLWYKNLSIIDNDDLKIRIPVNKDWNRHDLYISAVLFNSPHLGDETSFSSELDHKQSIKRAIGLVHLPLERSERKLSLSIETMNKSRPLTSLPIKVSLDKNVSEYESVMMTLAAVDVGVLNVSNYTTPDAFSWFFSQRRYDIDSLDMYGHIMDGRRGITGKQRFGGDMDMTSAGNLQKAKVKIVSLFHKPVTFDEQGVAHLELDIPDFNGQLRLMVMAFSQSKYGHLDKNITIAAPVVTQLSMPLFLAANDESSLTLDVHNMSGHEQMMDIQLIGDKVVEVINSKRQLKLTDNEKSSLIFPVKSKDLFGLSNIQLTINRNHLNDNEARTDQDLPEKINIQRQWQLSVRPAWPAVQRNEHKIINANEQVNLKLQIDDLMNNTVTSRLLLSNQPPINLASHMTQLLKYPYGCLEQTTSSSFPWLFAQSSNMEKLGLQDIKIKNKPVEFTDRKKQLERGVQRLTAKQLSNGGFGLWSNQSSEELWLTAYASHFLLLAREQNIDVPANMLKSAIKRLQEYLRTTRPGYNYRYTQAPEHLTIAYKSYAAYVLSSLKQAPLGTMRTLFDYHSKDAQSGLPLMHLGIAMLRQGDLKRGREAINQSLLIKRDDDRYLGDYGSNLRDIALMIHALVLYEPSHKGISSLLYELQEELGKRKWLSTQERNALFMAGVALKETDDSQWQAIIETLTGKQKIIHEGDFQVWGIHRDSDQEITLQSLNTERLYASLDVNGYTRKATEPDFEHFNITRSYYNTQGKMIRPEQVAVGELLIVELSLHSKNRIQDALVVDLIPAGFELENQNLTHSLKLDEYRIGDQSLIDRLDRGNIKYQEWRDDRYVAAVDLNSYGTQRLYYLLRAVTPGKYQVPPPYAEDMYRPYIRAIGETSEPQTIVNRQYRM